MKFILSIATVLLSFGMKAQCEYSETFEAYANGSTLPTGWSSFNTTGSTAATVQIQSNAGAPSPSKYLRITNGTAATTGTGNLVTVLPMSANTSDGNHRVSFYLNGTLNSTSSLQVGTIDVPNSTGTFQQIKAITGFTTGTVWTKYYVDIPAGTNQYIAFRHSLNSANSIFSIDNICFQQIPTCLEVTGLNTTNIAAKTISFSWTNSSSNESKWEYLVQPKGQTAPATSTTGTEVLQNNATATGLNPDTAYDIYVRSKCSAVDFGAWQGPISATTSCSDYTANYFSGFEDNVNAEEVKPCWSVYDTGNGDLKTFGATFGVIPTEGALQLRFYFLSSTPANSLALISPEFSDLSSNKKIRFKMNKTATSTANMKIEIGTVASPTDMSSFVLLDDTSLTQSTISATIWKEYTISLSNYNNSLNHRYIAFRTQHSGTGATISVLMDEFNYEYDFNVLNDEPETSRPITASNGYQCENAINGTFTGATHSAETPCTATPYKNYVDLWYKFVAPTTDKYALGLNVTGTINANMFVWTGTPGNLIQLPSGCSTRYNQLNFVAGQTYYISIGALDPNLAFNLCIQKLPGSVNDEPANAIALTESTTDVCENGIEGNTVLATHSTDSTCPAGQKDVWYTFIPTKSAEYTIRRTFLNGSAPTGISLYSGTPGNLVRLNEGPCTEQLILANLTGGQKYYIAVSGSDASNPVYFKLCAYLSPPVPANDICSQAIPLTVGTSFDDKMIIGDNTSATVDLSNTPMPTCGRLEFETSSRDIWFTVTVPPSGNFIIETRNSDGSLMSDTAMEVYTGSCGATTLQPYYYNLPPPNVGTAYCNDQYVIGGNQFAGIKFEGKTPGEKILVRVWGWAFQFGKFKISAYDNTVLGVNDIPEKTSKVYPNPVENIINIHNENLIKNVQIFDMTGKLVYTKTVNAKKSSLELSHLSSGAYILKIITGNNSESVKILKK